MSRERSERLFADATALLPGGGTVLYLLASDFLLLARFAAYSSVAVREPHLRGAQM